MTSPEQDLDASRESVEGLGATGARSAAWGAGSALLVRALRLLSFFVLARLVTEEAFGLLALATALVAVAQVAGGFGLHQFIIRAPTLRRGQADSVFWASAGVGLVLAVLVAAMAPVFAAWFGEPELLTITLALSPLPLLAALSVVPTGLLWRRLHYRSLSLRNLFAAVSSVVLALVLAALGFGVWALVAQILCEATVGLVALWAAARSLYLPGRHFDREEAAEALRFGWRVVGGDLLTLASFKADDVIVGAVLGTVPLGVYSVSYRILAVLRESLQATSGTVAYGLFSRLQHDASRLRAGFERACAVNAAVAFPAFVYVSAAAVPIVDLCLGPRWTEAAPVVSALAAVGLAAAATDLNLSLLTAMGHAGDTLRFSFVNTVLNVIGFLIAVHFGIVWVALAFSVRGYLMVPYAFVLLRRRAEIDTRRVLAVYARITVACLGVLACGLAAPRLGEDLGSFGSLVVTSVSAALAYAGLLRLVAPGVFSELLLTARGLRSRQPA